MKKFFNYEGGVWKALGKIADLMVLNFIYIICCIPIFTMGAAKTAMYGVTKKMAKNEESYIIRNFFSQFKENFKKSTILWLIYIACSILPIIDLYVCFNMENNMYITFCEAVMILTLVTFNLILLYSMALLSTFENTLKNTIKNALIMAIGNFPLSVLILIINFSPYIAVLFFTSYLKFEVPLIIFIWFALAAFVNSFLFNRIFKKFM